MTNITAIKEASWICFCNLRLHEALVRLIRAGEVDTARGTQRDRWQVSRALWSCGYHASLEAAMDLVGFACLQIVRGWYLSVVEIGGWNPMVVSSQRFNSLPYRNSHQAASPVPPHLTSREVAKPCPWDIVLTWLRTRLKAVLHPSPGISNYSWDSSAGPDGAKCRKKISTLKAWDNCYGVLQVRSWQKPYRSKLGN